MAKPKVSETRAKLVWGRIWESAQHFYKGSAKQHIIATDSDKTPQLVSKWRNGKSMPSPETLERLADKYSVSIAWLSGQDVEAQEGEFDRFSEASSRAFSISREIAEEVLPEGTHDQYFHLAEKAMGLALEGKDDSGIRGILFEEARRMKREG